MRDRIESALKMLCLGLGGLLLLQLALRVPHLFPLHGVKIPALPALAAAEVKTNAPSEKKPVGVASSTNQTSNTNRSANASAKAGETNSVALIATAATNLASPGAPAPGATNQTSLPSGSSAVALAKVEALAKKGLTNKATALVSSRPVSDNATNRTASTNHLAARSTNSSVPSLASVASTNTSKSSSNLVARADQNSMPRQLSGPAGGRPGRSGAKPVELGPAAQAEVDRVVDSELFGPVFHPMPMALMGIAGDMAFLRAPTGQSSAVKEGDNLGAIKLLRIGINRVLVEEDGQKKELMIFEGAGGESLMPK